MNIEILLSCMYQKDFSLIETSRITLPTLLVNQCDEEGLIEQPPHRLLNTKTRGIVPSRNIALDNARGDILLFADDDQEFIPDLEKQVTAAYQENPDADMIIFQYALVGDPLRKTTRISADKPRQIKRLECLRVSTFQISIKKSVLGKVRFDTKLITASDTKFVLDAYDKGLKIYVSPIEITKVSHANSSHFFGYDENYFYKRGQLTRYLLGLPMAVLYAFYFLAKKHDLYEKTCSPFKAFKAMLKGFANPIK